MRHPCHPQSSSSALGLPQCQHAALHSAQFSGQLRLTMPTCACRHLMRPLRSWTHLGRSRTRTAPSSCSCCATTSHCGPQTCRQVTGSKQRVGTWGKRRSGGGSTSDSCAVKQGNRGGAADSWVLERCRGNSMVAWVPSLTWIRPGGFPGVTTKCCRQRISVNAQQRDSRVRSQQGALFAKAQPTSACTWRCVL